MPHVMIDIETMGKKPGCAVLSIGAAIFAADQTECIEPFYRTIQLQSCVAAGLHLDPSTVAWLCKQNAEVRAVISDTAAQGLATALADLKNYLIAARKKDNMLQLWANDPDFDLSILTAAFEAVDETLPWNYYEGRSVRTILALSKDIKGFDAKASLQRIGTHHNALDDVLAQAMWVSAAWRALRE